MADPNPFDQFDAPAAQAAPAAAPANPFDQFDEAPAHDADSWVRSNLIASGLPASTVGTMEIGPLDRASAALHAMTAAASRGMTFGLSDKAAAAGEAAGSAERVELGTVGHALKHVANWAATSAGLPSLYDAPTDGTAPATTQPAAAPGPTFASALADQRQAGNDFYAAHPAAAIAANGTGMLGTLGMGAGLAPATLAGKMAVGAGIGGTTGAVSGFANAPEGEALKDTAIGAGLGTVLGGAAPAIVTAASPIVGRVVQALRPGAAEDAAVGMIGNAIRQDANAGGPGIPQISDALANAGTKPMTIADVGGQNMLGAAGQVARAPGESRQVVADFLNNRDAGAGLRLIGDVQDHISNGQSAYRTVQDQIAQRGAAAEPLYEKSNLGGSIAPLQSQFEGAFGDAAATEAAAAKAVSQAQQKVTLAAAKGSQAGDNVYANAGANTATQSAQQELASAQQALTQAQTGKASILSRLQQAQADGTANAPGAVWNPRIQQFLDDPIMAGGIQRGLQIQRLESLAAGKPFNPTEFAITGTAADGSPIVGSVPNMRLLDAGKKGLDAIINDNTDQMTGKVNELGRAVTLVKQSYLKQLDGINPDYAAARASFAGPSSAMNAVRQGEKIFDMHPDQIADTIANLDPANKDFFLNGTASALTTRIAKVGTQGNEARQIVGTDYLKQQLRPLFKTDADFDSFVNKAQAESTMFGTKQAVLGGSQTAGRLAQDGAGAGSGMLGGLGQAAAGAVSGEPGLMGLGVAKLLSSLNKSSQIPTPAANAAAARLLFSSDPAANASTLARALAASQAPSKTLASSIPLATLPGSIYPRIALPPSGSGTP